MSWLNGFLLAGLTPPVSWYSAEEKPKFDPNSVTPGVIGFVATFLIILIVVALVIDMVRRIRRTQYRAEVNALLDAEEAAQAERQAGDADDATDGPSSERPADQGNGGIPER